MDNSNDKRETRKEVRAALDLLQELLTNLEQRAVTYHAGETPDVALAAEIKRDLYRRIPGRLLLFSERGLAIESLTTEVLELRKAITLNNFDSQQFKQLHAGSELLNHISLCRENLGGKLELTFARRFPSPRRR